MAKISVAFLLICQISCCESSLPAEFVSQIAPSQISHQRTFCSAGIFRKKPDPDSVWESLWDNDEWIGRLCFWCRLRQLPDFRNPQSLAAFFSFLRSARKQLIFRAELWQIGAGVYSLDHEGLVWLFQKLNFRLSPQGSISSIEWCWHTSTPPIEFMTDTEGPRSAVISWLVLNTVLLDRGFELIYNCFLRSFSWLTSSLSGWGIKCAREDVVTIFDGAPCWLSTHLLSDRPVKFKNCMQRGQDQLAQIGS